MRRNKRFMVGGLFLVAALVIFYYIGSNTTGFLAGKYKSEVSRVIDGDTVELATKERVRLLGINTPERGQHFYKESKDYLKGLVENKTVFLESDVEDKDKYGRLLRHIYMGGLFVNIELIKAGYASAYIIPPDEKYKELFLEAEEGARSKGIGIWKITIKDAFCIGIFEFHYNARGNDNENLNGEYVVFRNACNYTVNMDGWHLKDEGKNEYMFKNFSVAEKAKFTLYSGSGKDTETELYWNRTRAVWNNNGDGLMMWNADNELILDYSY